MQDTGRRSFEYRMSNLEAKESALIGVHPSASPSASSGLRLIQDGVCGSGFLAIPSAHGRK
jgi:hypothetical protein